MTFNSPHGESLPSAVHWADRTNITVEGWGPTYLRTLPQTQFTDAFLFNLTTIFRQYDDGPAFVTRDGMSLEEREKEERPYLLKKGEVKDYEWLRSRCLY